MILFIFYRQYDLSAKYYHMNQGSTSSRIGFVDELEFTDGRM